MEPDNSLSSVPAAPGFPLSFATQGETVTLLEIRAGDKLRQRLAELGLHVGMQVRVVQSDAAGGMIIAVQQDARVALGHGMTHKIMVQHAERKV